MSQKTNSWQNELIESITDPFELIDVLQLDSHLLKKIKEVIKLFPLKVTKSFLARIKKSDPFDPLLLQILPHHLELEEVEGFSKDPLLEKGSNPVNGLLHKYEGRVLLTLTGNCAINCRYCFRRHFPYKENNPGLTGWSEAFDYIKKDPSIREVILSGGDPLIATDTALRLVIDNLNEISHIKLLRIHTRLPVVLPSRITTSLVEIISAKQFKTVMVIHCNHANELNNEVRDAIASLRRAGITILNQSVLLKGVNDSVSALIELSEKLFELDILPYYLHLLDKVQGCAHFDRELTYAKQLYAHILKKLPGFLVPKLVYEQPGSASKMPVGVF